MSKQGSRLSATALTNLVSVLVLLSSFVVPAPFSAALQSIGWFALAGALTNAIAIHMLFERVPGLRGSGVIMLRFDSLREALQRLIMTRFFTRETIGRVLDKAELTPDSSELQSLVAGIDLDPAWERLQSQILASSWGKVVAMVGGEAPLERWREPFKTQVRRVMQDMVAGDDVHNALEQLIAHHLNPEAIERRVGDIVEARLAELTPQLVKKMMQDMIAEHLGWLVVWGGLFGGIIGFLAWALPLLAAPWLAV